MSTVFVVSPEEYAGRTTICAGLGRYWTGKGRQVGFMAANGDAASAAFMKEAFFLDENTDVLAPKIDGGGAADGLKRSLEAIAGGKDVVLVEDGLDKEAPAIAQALDARVIVVTGYAGRSTAADSARGFGKNLLGVIFNKVPGARLKQVRQEAEKAGVSVLGVLPEDRALLTVTVGELAELISAKILNSGEKADELVENFMLGAMVVDSGLSYFGRKGCKAAIVRSDRPDMQLAALETPSRCLVISGGTEAPFYKVQQKAEDRGIPIVQSERDSATIISGIDDALDRVKIGQDKKVPRIADILQQNLDLAAVDKELGLAAN